MSQNITEMYTNRRGILHLKGYNKSGNLVFEDLDENLIVSSARVTLATLLGDGDPVKKVKYVMLGTDPSFPNPDNRTIGGLLTTDIELGQNKVGDKVVAYMREIGAHTYPEDGHVAFHFTFSYGDANGLGICEFGLVSEDGTMFSRKTRGLIEKDEELAIDGTWTIIF